MAVETIKWQTWAAYGCLVIGLSRCGLSLRFIGFTPSLSVITALLQLPLVASVLSVMPFTFYSQYRWCIGAYGVQVRWWFGTLEVMKEWSSPARVTPTTVTESQSLSSNGSLDVIQRAPSTM